MFEGNSIITDSTGFKLLYEEEVVWNRLCEKQILIEHKAIITEDSKLLRESVGDFLTSVKRWFQWMAAEWVRYLNKMLDYWTKLAARFRAWNLDEGLEKKLEGKSITLSAKDTFVIRLFIGKAALKTEKIQIVSKAIDSVVTCINNKVELDVNSVDLKAFVEYKQMITNNMQEINSHANDQEMPINDTDLKMVYVFIKEWYPQAIKYYADFKNKVTKVLNDGITSAGSDTAKVNIIKRNVSWIKEVVSSWIKIVNHAVKAAIKAIERVKSGVSTADNINSGDLTGGNNSGTPNPQQQNQQPTT